MSEKCKILFDIHDILRTQRKIQKIRPKKIAKQEKITEPNQLWQMDLK
jgi:hypothetical protein